MKKLLASLLLVGALGAPATAQIIGPPSIVQSTSDYPAGATPITGASGTVAAAPAVATLAAVATKTTHLCGFIITSTGSTAAAVVAPTITGLITGTWTLAYATVAGVTLANQSIIAPLGRCVPASAVNTAIVLTVPTLGAGNTNSAVAAWGYQL